jgi:hypothetical protein
VGSSELADNAVDTAAIADQAVTLSKLEHGTSSNSGKFLRANNGADPTFETITVPASINNLVEDTSPQLGGNLDVNTKNIVFGDSSDGSTDDVLKFGATTDLKIYHDGTDSYIDNESGYLYLNNDSSGIRLKSGNSWANGKMAAFYADGAAELYHDNVKRIETSSVGANVSGNFSVNDGIISITHSTPIINFNDNSVSNGNDYAIQVNTNLFKIVDTTNNNRLGFQFGSDGNTTLGGNVTLSGDLRASADSTHSLGTNTVRWANVYADTYYGDGSNLTGVSSVGGANSVTFNDNVKVKLGTDQDMLLYHNDTDGQLANSKGNLILANSTTGEIFIDPKNNERGIVVKPDAAVEIYHNNIKKLESESSGINIISSTPLLNFNANNVAQCAQFQVSESSGGGVLIFKNKHTSGNLEEAFRINNDGTMSFSGAGTPNSSKLSIANNGTHITCRSFGTGGYDSIFFRSANTNVGKIHFNSGGVQYHTSSDYRRKQNIVDLTGAISRIKSLLPKRFNFISEPDVTRDGFLAHEVTGAVPEAILGTKDQVATEKDVEEGRADKIGDPVYQTIDQAALIPLLTAAIKELISRVEALEAA